MADLSSNGKSAFDLQQIVSCSAVTDAKLTETRSAMSPVQSTDTLSTPLDSPVMPRETVDPLYEDTSVLSSATAPKTATTCSSTYNYKTSLAKLLHQSLGDTPLTQELEKFNKLCYLVKKTS